MQEQNRHMQRMHSEMMSAMVTMSSQRSTTEIITTPDITNSLPYFAAKKNDSANDYIRNLERAAIHQRWNQNLRVPMAVSRIRGEAKDWHETTGRDSEDSWDDWKNAFLEHFERESSLTEWIDAIQSRVQNSDETLSAYIQAKLRILRNGKFVGSDQDKIDVICQGIRNPATLTSLWKKYDDLESFLSEARVRQRLDEYLERNRSGYTTRRFTGDNSNETRTPSNRQPAFNRTEGNSSNDFQRTVNAIVANKTERWPKANYRHLPTNRNETNRVKCFNCDGFDHFSRDCSRPKTEQTKRAEKRRSERNPNGQTNYLLRSNDQSIPVISGLVNDKYRTRICIDTGANISMVNEKIVSADTQIYDWTGSKRITVLNTKFEPKQFVNLEIEIGTVKLTLPNVIVSPHCPFDLLLGSDWRKAAGVDVTFHSNNDVTIAKSNRSNENRRTDAENETKNDETLSISCYLMDDNEKTTSKIQNITIKTNHEATNDQMERFQIGSTGTDDQATTDSKEDNSVDAKHQRSSETKRLHHPVTRHEKREEKSLRTENSQKKKTNKSWRKPPIFESGRTIPQEIPSQSDTRIPKFEELRIRTEIRNRPKRARTKPKRFEIQNNVCD